MDYLISTWRAPIRQRETNFLADPGVIGQGVMVLNWTRVSLDYLLVFCNDDGEALALIAQKRDRHPILGNVQGQVGQGSVQSDLVKDVSVHCRGVKLWHLKGSFKLKLFYDSMIYGMRGMGISRNTILYLCVFIWQSRVIVLVSAITTSSGVCLEVTWWKYKEKNS